MKYRKTEFGNIAFKDRSVALSPKQRSAFIMFDGKKDETEVFKSMAGIGVSSEDVNYLVENGMIELIEDAGVSSPVPAKVTAADSASPALTRPAALDGAGPSGVILSDQERYQRAYPIATKLTSSLGLSRGFRGFRLNLSLEGASNYADLMALAPKIREAVGDEKFAELARALRGD